MTLNPIGSVLIAMYGATAAKVAYSLIDLTTNQACCNLIIDNNIKDITPLRSLTELYDLDLSMNFLKGEIDLKYFTNIEFLNLSDNKITKLSGFDKLNYIDELDISNNFLEEILFLKDIPSITYLCLCGNPIKDYSALENLEVYDLEV